jgi:hypothetical protein
MALRISLVIIITTQIQYWRNINKLEIFRILVLYGASCGGKENIPQSPEVAKILSDFVNNRSQDIEKVLSVIFPL